MKKRCPRCESDFIRSYTKTQYFIKSVACFFLILFCWWAFNAMQDEKDVGLVVLLTLLGSPCLAFLSLILGVYYGTKGFLIKETNYKCEYCKHKFVVPFIQTDT
jgi:DNA-directed RNA polymerase subunit RPC12/RpoP